MGVDAFVSVIPLERDEDSLLGAGSPPEGFFANSVAFADDSLMIDEMSEEAYLERVDGTESAGNTPIVEGRRPETSRD